MTAHIRMYTWHDNGDDPPYTDEWATMRGEDPKRMIDIIRRKSRVGECGDGWVTVNGRIVWRLMDPASWDFEFKE